MTDTGEVFCGICEQEWATVVSATFTPVEGEQFVVPFCEGCSRAMWLILALRRKDVNQEVHECLAALLAQLAVPYDKPPAEVAQVYRLTVERDHLDSGWVASEFDAPGIVGQGDSRAEAAMDLFRAHDAAVAS